MIPRTYTRTFVGMGIVLAALVAAALLSNSVAADAKKRYERVVQEAKATADGCAAQHERTSRLGHAMVPVREFAAAWSEIGRLPEKGAAEHIRADIEAIAQRQLGLVTDNAITPQPERYTFQGVPVRVQKVTLRASGKDLVALLTWLGKVEEKYPAAVVESCDFSSNVGGNTGLTVRLVQPLIESAAQRLIAPSPLPDLALLPDAIGAVTWSRYLPARVKGPVAVGFQRNPLQPAVAAEQRPLAFVHSDSDEIAPRLENALAGHVRSVIRGGSPLVVIDGRVFRVGDEIVVGVARERVISDAKAKLKQIGDDRLVLQVYGGTNERPIQCDVVYELPSFLRAR